MKRWFAPRMFLVLCLLFVACACGCATIALKARVPWRLASTGEQPKRVLMMLGAVAQDGTLHVEWLKFEYPFEPGTLSSGGTATEYGVTVSTVFYYDFYFVFADGSVAHRAFSPQEIEAHKGGVIDIAPEPRTMPTRELRALLNEQGAGI